MPDWRRTSNREKAGFMVELAVDDTAPAAPAIAVAYAVLAVADELAEIRKIMGGRDA